MDIHIDPMTKGYTQIYTGGGKGKTTAALGLAMRAAGAGLKVYIGEFIKEMEYGEIGIIRERFPEITVELYGNEAGCIIDRETDERDRRSAQEGFARAKAAVAGGEYDVVILDRIHGTHRRGRGTGSDEREAGTGGTDHHGAGRHREDDRGGRPGQRSQGSQALLREGRALAQRHRVLRPAGDDIPKTSKKQFKVIKTIAIF